MAENIKYSNNYGPVAYQARLIAGPDGTFAPEVSVGSNITTKFRDAFETDPNTSGNWSITTSPGDIITVDGNAAAASYAVVSLNPLAQGTQSVIESVEMFGMPVELAIGSSMSQRTLGQEFSTELVSNDTPLTPPADLAISTMSQATTTLTVSTTIAHGLRPGMRIGIRDCLDSRMNYPALVVASTPTTTQFTATAGPGGTIPSLTVGPFTSGFVFFRSALGFAPNGSSMIFENATATNASFYIRSESGDVLPSGTITGSHSVTINTTASVQAINAALTYAFQPTSVYRLTMQADRLQWSDSAVDVTTQTTSRVNRDQVIPDPSHQYKFRIRARNNASLSVPVGKIVTAVKTGTTTATITTDVAHGLTTADFITVYGIRDQSASAFPNLLTATAVASVIDATSFTVVIGTAATVTSYGGLVARVNGGNLPSTLGYSAVVVSTITRTSNILTIVGNASWSGLLIGDYVNLHGVRINTTGADRGVDGAYRVQNVATTTLTLEPINDTVSPTGLDFTVSDCGGAVIKRTDMRISFVRVFDYERERVEVLPRPSGDLASAVPVSINNTPAVTMTSTTISGGQAAHDAVIAGNPMRIGARGVTSNYTGVATGDTADLISTLFGVQITKPYSIPEAEWAFTGALTTTSDVAVQTAAGAGLKRHVTWVQATNTGASAVDVLLRDATTTRLQFTVPAAQSVTFALPTGIPLTANAALNVALSAAGTVRFNALGYTAA